jgi:heptosyltransferase-2
LGQEIVIIHGGAVGDLVQTLPTLQAIRTTYPEAHITLVGRPERAVLAYLARSVDARTDVETSGLWRIMGAGAGAPVPPVLGRASLVVDFLTRGRLEAALGRGGATRVVTVEPLPPKTWSESAATWIGREVASRLDLCQIGPAAEIHVPEAVVAEVRRRRNLEGVGPFLAVHPGSGSLRKNWPAECFVAMTRRVRAELGRAIVWLAGPAEYERGTLPGEAVSDVILDRLELDEVAAVAAMADGWLGNDSGATQIAAAVRHPGGRAVPVVVLFGPSDPRVWAPRGGHVQVVTSADGTMAGVEAEDVWAALGRALEGRNDGIVE